MPNLIGQRLGGRYHVEALLGSGGMGSVYRALDERTGEEIALKLIRPERLPDVRLRRQLAAEVRAVAALDHPAVVRVLDQGRDPAGGHFFTMELVEGGSLARHVPGTIPWRHLRRLFAHLLSALAHAHAREIVHRDLKPSNLLLPKRPGRSRIKLMDFGIARIRSEAKRDLRGSRERRVGEERKRRSDPLGTPAFMAPEQVLGEEYLIGPATDLFAVGVLLQLFVTGRHPHLGDTPAEQLRQQVHAPPAPALLPGGEAVPAPMARLLEGLLAKNSRRRMDCAAEVRRALLRIPATAIAETEARRPEGDAGSGNRRAIVLGGAKGGEEEGTVDVGALDSEPEAMPASPRSVGAAAGIRLGSGAETAGAGTTGWPAHDVGEGSGPEPRGLGTRTDLHAHPSTTARPAESERDGAGMRGAEREARLDTQPLQTGTDLLAGALPRLLDLREPPLVGREAECAVLGELAVGVESTRESAVAAIVGGRGTGKTRLAQWVCRDLMERGRFRTLFLSCNAADDGAFDTLLARAFCARAGLVPDEVEATADALACFAREQDPERWRAVAAALQYDVLGVPGDRALRALHHARALRAWSRGRPVALAVDNIPVRGASELALGQLAALVEAARHVDLALLVVVTSSAAEAPMAQQLEAAALPSAAVLALAPLAPQSAAHIPPALLPMAPSTARRIVDHVGGVPRNILEFMHYAARVGGFHLQAGRFWLHPGWEEGAASPPQAKELLEARLEAIRMAHPGGRRALRLLALAAVLGRRFPQERLRRALRSLAPELGPCMEEDLALWTTEALLVDTPDGAIFFQDGLAHRLLLDIAAGDPCSRDWYAWDARDRAAAEPRDAWTLARIAGRLLQAGAPEAVPWAMRALRALLRAGYPGQAEELVRRLDGAPAVPSHCSLVHWLCGRVALENGEGALAEERVEHLRTRCSDPLAPSRAAHLRARILLRHSPQDALALLHEAIAHWPETGTEPADLDELLSLHLEVVELLRSRGAYRDAEQAIAHALALGAEHPDAVALQQRLRCSLAFIYLETARYEEALAETKDVLCTESAARESSLRVDLLKVQSGAVLRLGDPDTATGIAEEAFALVVGIGHARQRAVILNLLSMCRHAAGRMREALALAREALDAAGEAGDPVMRGRILNNLGSAAMGLGRHQAAMDAWREALQVSSDAGDMQNEARTRTNLATLLLELGECEDGLRVLSPALDALRAMKLPHLEVCEALAARLRASDGEASGA